jgi:hypothetical protein
MTQRDNNFSLSLYQRVALSRDLPEQGMHRGDVATIVDFVQHPEGGEDGCVLEVFNAVGESIAVVATSLSTVEPLRPDEVLSVRPLSGAA